MPGADGAFDAALTNGLLSVVATALPAGATSKPSGYAPPASKLLEELVAAFGNSGGFTEIPTGEEQFDLDFDLFTEKPVLNCPRPQRVVRLATDLLTDALKRTQPARRGRGPSGLLTVGDVEALAVLDDHPALGVLSEYRQDLVYREGRVEDAREAERAYELLAMLSEDDVASRVAHAIDAHGGAGSWDESTPLQACPVCGNETLVGQGLDEYGYGIVLGTCLVCSYRQTLHATEQLNLEAEWEARWADE